MLWEKWDENDPVNFNNIGYDIDHYKIDNAIYHEIKNAQGFDDVILKSSKLSVRQTIRMGTFINRFSKISKILEIVLILFVVFQIILMIIK